MKNLTIIITCLISLSSSLSLFPSFPLPSVPLYPSSLLSLAMKDPVKELTKVYCSLKNSREARRCDVENHQQKPVNVFRDCMVKVKPLKTLGEITDFYCNKMNPEESAKAKACLDPAMKNLVATDATFLPTVLNCMFKVKQSEK